MKKISSILRSLWSFIGLDIGWLSCVLGAALDMHWLGLLTVILLCLIHLYIIGRRKFSSAILLGMSCIAVGFIVDTILINFKVFEPNRWILPRPITTIWLLMLWANFSLALNESLKWFQKHLFISALMGSFFGPLAYLAASRIGAVRLTTPFSNSLIALGIAWFLAMPLISFLSKFFYNNISYLRNR